MHLIILLEVHRTFSCNNIYFPIDSNMYELAYWSKLNLHGSCLCMLSYTIPEASLYGQDILLKNICTHRGYHKSFMKSYIYHCTVRSWSSFNVGGGGGSGVPVKINCIVLHGLGNIRMSTHNIAHYHVANFSYLTELAQI